jgi:hypothetical protein
MAAKDAPHSRRDGLMKRAVLLAAAIAITGCTPDKKADLATCEKETLRFYSDSSGDDFTIACMDARGYRFEVEPSDCDGKSRMVRQAACYVPENWFAAFLDGLGRPSKPTPAAEAKPAPPETKPPK